MADRTLEVPSGALKMLPRDKGNVSRDLTPLVRECAFYLWKKAGEPYGREFEFWSQASQEIETEQRAERLRFQANRIVAR
jgi:hypothetical protein